MNLKTKYFQEMDKADLDSLVCGIIAFEGPISNPMQVETKPNTISPQRSETPEGNQETKMIAWDESDLLSALNKIDYDADIKWDLLLEKTENALYGILKGSLEC